MIENAIAEVPDRIWKEGRPARSRAAWQGQYNIASWISVSGAMGRVALSVGWRDDAGEHRVEVDSTNIAGDGSALLSGMVTLRFTGQVSQVQMLLVLPEGCSGFVVEELFVQRRGSQLTREDKLISNF